MVSDLAGLCSKAYKAATEAANVSDELHIALIRTRIREHWPEAASWTRQFVPYDDMPGGDWYLIGVEFRNGEDPFTDPDTAARFESEKEEIDNLLADLIMDWGESLEERVEFYDDVDYEGPAPTREQAKYFAGPYAGIRRFWPMWDNSRQDRNAFDVLCDNLSIPSVIRNALWQETILDNS